MPRRYRIGLAAVSAALLALAAAAPAPQTLRCRVTGLFDRSREEDLRQAVGRMAGVSLVDLDFDTSVATFSYDPAKLFPQSKEKEYVERFDNLLRSSSSHTFGIRPLSTTPRDKLVRIEIPVVGLDCKGCSLAAYEIIIKIEGVEQATASFRLGLVTALIDPEKTRRETLEEALKKRGVKLKAP